MFKISQTELLEWVKDGNAETLQVYFQQQLEQNSNRLQEFFAIQDKEKRTVVHWAAYFGQLQLLENWLTQHARLIKLNQEDMHKYTALDLASLKGFTQEYDSLIQFSLIKLLHQNGAQIKINNKQNRATPLHWAYYYGNQELIDFLINEYPQLQYQLDNFGMYPIDYLFLENRPQQYQKHYKNIFIQTVVHYAKTNDGHIFQNLRAFNTQLTIAIRSQSLKSNYFENQNVPELKDPPDEIESNQDNRNYNYIHTGLTGMTLMTKLQSSSSNYQKRDSLTSRISQQFKNIQEKMKKLQNKNDINDQLPFENSQELHEPEAEKIPYPLQPTNTIFTDPHININGSQQNIINQVNSKNELESERNQQKNLLDEDFPRFFISKNIQSHSDQQQQSQYQQSNAPSQFGRQFSQEIQISQDDFRPSMREFQQIKSIKPSLKRPGQKGLARKSTTFNESFTIYHYEKSQTTTQLFECRLQFWSARIESVDFFLYFLKKQCNPFLIQYQGLNCLHIAASKGKYKIIKCIVENDYEYQELKDLQRLHQSLTVGQFAKTYVKKNIFNKLEVLNMITEQNPSNALHLAIEINNYKCMQLLVGAGVSFDVINHRCLKPFELTYDEQMIRFYQNNLLKNKVESFIFMGYAYIIQTNGQQDLGQDIVMLQLENIRQTFRQKHMEFEFITINTPNYSYIKNKQECCVQHHYYVIKMSTDTIYRLADKYEIECYHLTKKHLAKFKYRDSIHFEFPKPLQIQTLIINTLNEEFNLDKFVLEGLVISHFPLEDESKQKKVDQLWKQYQNECIKDSLRLKTHQIALRPLNSIAAYYGPVIGWYIAFNTQLVGWLIIPAVVGSAIQLYQLIVIKIQVVILPAYALFMSLWATLFMEKWKNRESELRFIWDLHKFKQQEPERVMYTGQYVVNQCTNRIEIYDTFTTFKRRVIAECPIIILGISIIILSFLAFNFWQSQQDPNNFIMPILINSLNGVSMTLFCDLYKRLCKSVVNWENHKYDLAMQYSYILKVFLFEFLISYISVVYAVIFKTNQTQLTISIASIIITRGLISNITSNFIPFLQYRYLSFRQKGLFETFLIFKKDFKIIDQQYVLEKLKLDRQIEFMKIMEDCNNKQPQKELYDEYTSIAIQFGYTTMFSPAFAASPLFFLINQYINLQFSIYNYQKVLKRERAQAADSIGIWLSIFEIMNYCSTFMNCIVIGVVNQAEFEKLINDPNPLIQALVLAAIEHFLLLIKYILGTAIPDCPYWVTKELRKYAYLEEQSKQQEDNSSLSD